MMFVIRKKRGATRFYCGMVPTIWIKQHKERPNFWNWHVGSLELGRLLDWLGEYERCLITQRERKTITGKAGLAPRVILVFWPFCLETRPRKLQRELWGTKCLTFQSRIKAFRREFRSRLVGNIGSRHKCTNVGIHSWHCVTLQKSSRESSLK